MTFDRINSEINSLTYILVDKKFVTDQYIKWSLI